MTADEARQVLRTATLENNGTFTQLRIGNSPGRARVSELRLALRILWRHLKAAEALPYELASSAAIIIHFIDEARSNLKASGQFMGPDLTEVDLIDLEMGAFELLSGADAETWIMPRADLGE